MLHNLPKSKQFLQMASSEVEKLALNIKDVITAFDILLHQNVELQTQISTSDPQFHPESIFIPGGVQSFQPGHQRNNEVASEGQLLLSTKLLQLLSQQPGLDRLSETVQSQGSDLKAAAFASSDDDKQRSNMKTDLEDINSNSRYAPVNRGSRKKSVDYTVPSPVQAFDVKVPLEDEGSILNLLKLRSQRSADLKRLIRSKSIAELDTIKESVSRIQQAKKLLWNLFEKPHLGLRNRIFNFLFNCIIFFSVCSPVFATTSISDDTKAVLSALDLFCTVAFTVELLIKIICSPNKKAFFKSLYTIIDFAVVIAGWVKTGLPEGNGMYLNLLSTQLPILRLSKITKHSFGWQLLVMSIRKSAAALLVPLYLMVLMVFFSGSLHFWLDQNFSCPGSSCAPEQLPAFESIPHAMWFVIESVSTVGYGDVVPHSVPGKILASLQIIAGICYMAMPLTIIGNTFTQVWEDRYRLQIRDLLSNDTSDMDLIQMKRIFDAFDPDGSGEVTLDEFIPFIDSLELNLPRRGIRALFNAIDLDGSNQLSFVEFIDFLFDGADLIE